MRALRVPVAALGISSALMANALHAQSTPSADAGAALERSSGGRYFVGGYVRNFTDEKCQRTGRASLEVNAGYTDPRTYGVILSVRF